MSNEKILRMGHLNRPGKNDTGICFQMCGTTYPNRNYVIIRPSSIVSCAEYVIRGTGHVVIDGKEFTLHAGDTYLLPEKHDHYYYSDKNDPWEKIWINFSGDFSLELLRLWKLEQFHHFPKLDTSDILQKFQYYTEHTEAEHAAERCTALMMQLFYRLSTHLYAPGQEEISVAHKLQRYIEQHVTEPITLEQIAASCGKSPSQAERIFHAETGTSLYRYALDHKISTACQLLTETGMAIREIADYLSFSDEFYFSGLFRRKVGVSPTRYRESGGKMEALKVPSASEPDIL